MSSDGPFFVCPRLYVCEGRTVIPPEVLKKVAAGEGHFTDFMTCETCGETPEMREARHEANRKLDEKRRAYLKKLFMEKAPITDDDRARRKADGFEGPFLKAHYYIPEFGRQGWMVTCSECGEYFRLFQWSYNGGGKRCPGCKTKYGGQWMLYQTPEDD